LVPSNRSEDTLKAIAEHNAIGALLPADGGGREEVLAQFASIGIDLNQLAAGLQEQAAKSSVDFWSELIAVTEFKAAPVYESVTSRRSKLIERFVSPSSGS
jgi:hypothetical protein